MSDLASPYLRYAKRMAALAEPLRGLDAAGLADRGRCLARWRRAGFVEEVGRALDPHLPDLRMPDLVEEREARRLAAIRLYLYPGDLVAFADPEPVPAIDARIRFAGLRAFVEIGRELASVVEVASASGSVA